MDLTIKRMSSSKLILWGVFKYTKSGLSASSNSPPYIRATKTGLSTQTRTIIVHLSTTIVDWSSWVPLSLSICSLRIRETVAFRSCKIKAPARSVSNYFTKSLKKSKKLTNLTEPRRKASRLTICSILFYSLGLTSISFTIIEMVSTQPRATTSSIPWLFPIPSIKKSKV